MPVCIRAMTERVSSSPCAVANTSSTSVSSRHPEVEVMDAHLHQGTASPRPADRHSRASGLLFSESFASTVRSDWTSPSAPDRIRSRAALKDACMRMLRPSMKVAFAVSRCAPIDPTHRG